LSSEGQLLNKEIKHIFRVIIEEIKDVSAIRRRDPSPYYLKYTFSKRDEQISSDPLKFNTENSGT
jgi:hypothetical protein